MSVNLRTLADFRRFLAQPGATIQVTRHDWAVKNPEHWNKRANFFDPRTVEKLQTNAVRLAGGSWLDWRGGAKGFRFDGNDTVTVDLKHDGSFSEIMTYRCWIA